jgi:hypothetical protein
MLVEGGRPLILSGHVPFDREERDMSGICEPIDATCSSVLPYATTNLSLTF